MHENGAAELLSSAANGNLRVLTSIYHCFIGSECVIASQFRCTSKSVLRLHTRISEQKQRRAGRESVSMRRGTATMHVFKSDICACVTD